MNFNSKKKKIKVQIGLLQQGLLPLSVRRSVVRRKEIKKKSRKDKKEKRKEGLACKKDRLLRTILILMIFYF